MSDFTIICDTREKYLWSFGQHQTYVKKLDTGDYTLEGLEDVLCIERKMSLSELYGNLTDDRFWKEMERMKNFQYKFLIVEAEFSDVMGIPYSLGLKKEVMAKLKLTPQFVLKKIGEIQIKYGIHVIFAGDKHTAAEIALNIMKRVNENR